MNVVSSSVQNLDGFKQNIASFLIADASDIEDHPLIKAQLTTFKVAGSRVRLELLSVDAVEKHLGFVSRQVPERAGFLPAKL